jgi:hypothetical protein
MVFEELNGCGLVQIWILLEQMPKKLRPRLQQQEAQK